MIMNFLACINSQPGSWYFIVLLILGMGLCAVNRLFLNAEKFIVGRDWVVVLGKDDSALASLSRRLLGIL